METVWQTYHHIWNEYLPKSTYKPADNFEFQRYSDGGTKMQICIPVEN
jgi:predicted transcriptional regulator YdeE